MLSIQAGAKVAIEAPKQRDRRLLVGTWLMAQSYSFKIHEEDGTLMRESLVLVEDGDYMMLTFPEGDCQRYKLGPSQDECILQVRAKDGDWEAPRYPIREGAVQAGTRLVTHQVATIFKGMQSNQYFGDIGSGTLVEAAGPPEVAADGFRTWIHERLDARTGQRLNARENDCFAEVLL